MKNFVKRDSETPLVSLVTPCFNGEKYIRRFLKSILNQTYRRIEVIFINDGSDDGTEDIVSVYQKEFEKRGLRFVYEFQKNAGQAAALNRGLKWMQGDYLVWPDSDDELMPEFLEKEVEFLQRHPETAYCYGKTCVMDEKEPDRIIGVKEKRTSFSECSFFERILYSRDVFYGGYMVRTALLKEVIPKLEIYAGAGGQNAQILLPFGWYYGEPGYVEEAVYKYYIRRTSHSHSLDTSEKIIQQLYHYEKILTATIETIPDPEIRPYLEKIQQHYAKLRFGNAVDTKNADLIRKQYQEYVKSGGGSFREFALYFKYTCSWIRKIFRIEG